MMPSNLPLRIGLLLDHPSPHMVALLDALAERTDCVAKVLYCDRLAPGRTWGTPAGRLPYTFVSGITLPGRVRFNPSIFRSLAQVKADIWVLNTIYTSPTTLLATCWLSRKKLPWVYVNEPPQPRNQLLTRLRRPLLSYVLERAWAVMGMGRRAQAIYQAILNGSKPVGSLPYYIELDGLDRLPLPQVPSQGQPIRFVTSGQMIRRKGLDVLLKACELLPREGWSLTVAGDGRLRQSLEQQFLSRWNSGRIRFMGNVAYENRASVFADKHVFVFPSRWDGWGMVVPEALAAGLPVVTTDQVISGHEFINEGQNGFIVPADDPKALAQKMAYFLDWPKTIPNMARAARESLEQYKPAVGAESLVRFLLDIFSESEPTKKRVARGSSSPLPTWVDLTRPTASLERMRREIRQTSKAAVCRTAVVLRNNTKPNGHRILVYHLVLPQDKKRFEEHVRLFKDNFLVGSVAEVFEAANNPEYRGPHRLAITFDDGFRMLMGTCLDVLEEYSVKGCFLVPTAYVRAHDDPELAAAFSLRTHHYSLPLEPLRPIDLKLLTDLGHEVGSHGIYHLSLGMVGETMAGRLLVDSRAQIASWTGKEPSTFAYPYGDVQSSVGEPASWVERAGYAYGLTLQRGPILPATNRFLLPREHAEGNWSLYAMKYFLSI